MSAKGTRKGKTSKVARLKSQASRYLETIDPQTRKHIRQTVAAMRYDGAFDMVGNLHPTVPDDPTIGLSYDAVFGLGLLARLGQELLRE